MELGVERAVGIGGIDVAEPQPLVEEVGDEALAARVGEGQCGE
jgi:hypothetical protein